MRLIATVGVGTPRFYENVYVNNVSLAGYTYDEGMNAMRRAVDEHLGTRYEMSFEGRVWYFTPALDADARIDVESKIQLAWNFGHTGGIFQREAQINALKANPVYLTSELQYDESKIDALIQTIKSEIDVSPVDAEVRLDATSPSLIGESSTGLSLSADELREQLISLMNYGGETSFALPVEIVEPSVSSDGAAGSMKLIVEYTTDTSVSSAARLSNIQTAMAKFNAYELKPGAQFSYNYVVGKRTAEAGFKEATAFSGSSVTTEIGGGVCQASSTLYAAALKAGLRIDERHNHSMTVSYTQASCDATVSDAANQDLKFTNNTDHTIYIYTEATDKTATVRFFSAPLHYTVELEINILETLYPNEPRYKNDVEGTHAYYVDDPAVMYSESRIGMKSECYRIFKDAATGETVRREKVSYDYYYPRQAVYWRGIHNHDGSIATNLK